jgi:Thymidylate synthase complementing protein
MTTENIQGPSRDGLVVFGSQCEPTEYSRVTSRSVHDDWWHGIQNHGSRSLSRDGRRTRSPSDNGMVQIGTDGIEVLLIQDFDDDVLDTVSRWSQSAGSGAPMELMLAKDPDEFLVGGLAYQSLEDFRVAFAVRGVSRVCTHQLVRTRAAAFKQQSQQDTWQGAYPEFRMPESVWVNRDLRREWIAALIHAHRVYNMAIDADVQYKDARYILPEGTTNFILCEYSLRTFIEMYAYRGCVMFQEELVYVTREMRRLLVEAHPYLEPHIKISCEKQHKCTFQGPERVEETCDFPWATEDNRVYRQSRSGFQS